MSDATTRAEPAKAAEMPPSPPEGWTDPAPDRPIPFWSALRQDLVAQIPGDRREKSAIGWTLTTARIALTSPGFKVTFFYRLNHTISQRGGRPGRLVAGIINWFVHHAFFCAIAPSARLHGGLILPHPQGVIIGSSVVVGPRAWIYQNVTIGGAGGKLGEPKIGADCRIHCGSVIAGPITLGDEVVVSPLSLVQRNVPSRSMAVGVPANVFPQFSKAKG